MATFFRILIGRVSFACTLSYAAFHLLERLPIESVSAPGNVEKAGCWPLTLDVPDTSKNCIWALFGSNIFAEKT